MESKKQIPIWFFIGILLAVYGVLIFAAGIYYGWISPLEKKLVLAEYHVDVWWGVLLMVIGGFYVLKFRPGKTAKE
jgi:hypothetical protein